MSFLLNASKDISCVYFFKWPYMTKFLHNTKMKLKICKQLWKRKSWHWTNFLLHSKSKIRFHINTLFLRIWNLSWYINLVLLAVVLATLVKYVNILKQGWETNKKDNRFHFLRIYILTWHALSNITIAPLKKLMKLTSDYIAGHLCKSRFLKHNKSLKKYFDTSLKQICWRQVCNNI